MRQILIDTDQLLRGMFTRKEELSQGRLHVSLRTLLSIALALGAVYGVSMGLFGLLRPEHATWKQALADAAKVPSLFLLTLAVSLPSLYAFSALANTKLAFGDTLRLLLAAIAVNLALLASFSPITAFFTVSTTSYPFMVLLNVAFFALSGFVGLAFLRKALHSIFNGGPPPPTTLAFDEHENEADRAVRLTVERARWNEWRRSVARPRRIFVCWFVIYALVGAQMSWILRPFIGTPGLEFELFRPRHGSFFEAICKALWQFLSGS
jgi:hypothetical protein